MSDTAKACGAVLAGGCDDPVGVDGVMQKASYSHNSGYINTTLIKMTSYNKHNLKCCNSHKRLDYLRALMKENKTL